ncbi:hypothetical protein [Nocardia vermiculata]|uniref:DUF885 domain-containing protein n=1 Tax=Nocardia vermiculata TaxID=257274 RepID=A0A846Y9B2_9NOCA|nr:hypothetical protein [Nocardia vermiculata]NKY54384.1 hypothetical protein [Nocardia vermiculata]
MTRQLRDAAEHVLRGWNRYEIERGAHPVIDYDCSPTTSDVPAVENRLEALQRLSELQADATAAGDRALVTRIDADIAYCAALLGEHDSLDRYIRRTQGCEPRGWSDEYLQQHLERAQHGLAALGIDWGPKTLTDLMEAEGPLDVSSSADAIREAAADLEPSVRAATGSTADYDLTIESVDVDAYWSYWLDGAGQKPRLRINRRNARFTHVVARQFALHEVLGHALQFASISARCADEDVPWIRLCSVHSPNQVLFEGLAQAMPLFVAPDDENLTTRVRLDHYHQLVRGRLHLALAAGEPILDLAERARRSVPYWTDSQIADLLTDRGANPLLRSYMWSYSAGIDWFIRLAETPGAPADQVLHGIYRAPHTPTELMAYWPGGPRIGAE